MYVGKSRTKTCLDQVLDFAQDCSSQELRTVKLQKEEVSYYEARPIERQIRLIENRVMQILNQAHARENI